jgi:hypothetical protein
MDFAIFIGIPEADLYRFLISSETLSSKASYTQHVICLFQ